MASENQAPPSWDAYITRMPLLRGLKLGLLLAASFTGIALVRVAIALVGLAPGDPSHVYAMLGQAGRFILWVVAGYALGFGAAGLLFAAVSHVRNRIVRYTLSGLLCGVSIYGACGIISNLMKGKTPNWTETAAVAGLLGLLWAVIGFVIGIRERRRERRSARHAG